MASQDEVYELTLIPYVQGYELYEIEGEPFGDIYDLDMTSITQLPPNFKKQAIDSLPEAVLDTFYDVFDVESIVYDEEHDNVKVLIKLPVPVKSEDLDDIIAVFDHTRMDTWYGQCGQEIDETQLFFDYIVDSLKKLNFPYTEYFKSENAEVWINNYSGQITLQPSTLTLTVMGSPLYMGDETHKMFMRPFVPNDVKDRPDYERFDVVMPDNSQWLVSKPDGGDLSPMHLISVYKQWLATSPIASSKNTINMVLFDNKIRFL